MALVEFNWIDENGEILNDINFVLQLILGSSVKKILTVLDGQKLTRTEIANITELGSATVHRLLNKLQSRQNIFDFWKPETNQDSPRTLRPDLVIEKKPENNIVIDTKWKMVDDNYPSDDDLKQMFAYAHYIGTHFLVLLYPSTTKNISKGSYIYKHTINGVEGTILCFLFKIPLEWDIKNQFKGLRLKEEDFNLMSTSKIMNQ